MAGVQSELDIGSEIQLRFFSLIQGAVVTVLNLLVPVAILWTTTRERHFTDTFHKRALVAKMSLFYLINSFVVPIVTAALRTNSYRLWYVPCPAPVLCQRGQYLSEWSYVEV